MTLAVAFALASLACAGVTDVVFKRYSRVDRPRGAYVMGVGLVWTAWQAAIVAATGGAWPDARAAGYGLAAGLLVGLSNTLLIESLSHVDVGLGSTIYRLNTIAVVVLAVVLLDEPLTGVKVTGVLLGVAAVCLLFETRHRQGGARERFLFYFGMALAASLLRAAFGILSKLAALEGVDLAGMLLVNAPVWVLIGALYGWRRRESLAPAPATFAYAVASGTLICGVANFLMLALARGEASVVVPIANMSFVVALLISVALGMERLTRRKASAVALAAAAIAMLSVA